MQLQDGFRSPPGPGGSAATAVTTLVVVGPHPLVRWGLGRAVDGYPDLRVVGEAGSRDEAVALCHMVRPDVVAVDTSLPDDSGWKLVAQLRAAVAGPST